jgi:hypothetical protein
VKGYDRKSLSTEELAEYRSRGIRRTRATNDLPLELFEEYAALVDPANSQLLSFRKAMVGWLVPRYSLYEVLEASVHANVGYADVLDAVAARGVGTHLYLWADSAFAPPSGAPRPAGALIPPHHQAYRDATRRWLTPRLTGDGRSPGDVVKVLSGGENSRDLSRVDRDRLRAAESWSRRHGGSILDRLGEAHIMALRLYTGPDKPIFHWFGTAGEPTQDSLRQELHSIVEGQLSHGSSSFPLLLMKHREFRKAAEQISAERSRQGRARHRQPLLDAVDRVVDAVFAEIPLHLAMAYDGLRRLPPAGENVFWAVREREPLTGAPGERPPGELSHVDVREGDEALPNRLAAMKDPVPAGGHAKPAGRIRLLEVMESGIASDLSPIVLDPARGRTMFRLPARLDVVSREIREDAGGEPYEHVLLRESDAPDPAAADPAAVEPDGREAPPADSATAPVGPEDLAPRAVGPAWHRVADEGRGEGLFHFTPSDWARRMAPYSELRNVKHLVQWQRDSDSNLEGGRWPLHRFISGGYVFYGRHGSDVTPPDLAEMRENLDLDSVENVIMLECGEGLNRLPLADAANSRQGRQAGDVAMALGKRVWIPQDGVAVTLAPGSREPVIHLREDGEGKATILLGFDPKTGRPSLPPRPAALGIEAEELPDATSYPAPEDWNAPVDTDRSREIPAEGAEDAEHAETAASRGAYRRTGPRAAELDGTGLALHESPGAGGRLPDTLLFTVRYAAPDALRDAGIDTSDAFRDWLERHVTDKDVPEDALPPLDGGRNIPVDLLTAIGVPLTPDQRFEGAFLGGLPSSEVMVSTVQQFRLLMRDPSYGGEGGGSLGDVLSAVVARDLGVEVAVVGPDGAVNFHGGIKDGRRTTAATPPAVVVRDGDRYLAGLPLGPGEIRQRLNDRP